MSPLLFLAIAIVVPLLGMAVLGVGARLKSQRVTDDETEPFRRRLASIAPRSSGGRSLGTPGLVQMMRRLRGARGADPADASDSAVEAAADNAGTRGAADSAASDAGTAGNDRGRRRRRGRRRQRTQRPETTTIGVVRPRATTASVRLIEREYSLPLLPPFSDELDDPAWQRRDPRRHAPARRPEAVQPPARTTEPPASSTQPGFGTAQSPADATQRSERSSAGSAQPGAGSALSSAGSARSPADAAQASARSARSPTSSIRLLPAQGSGRDQDQNRRPVSSPAADGRPGAVRRDAGRRVTSTVGAALTAPTAPEPPQAAPQFKGTVRLVEVQTPIVPPRNERVTSRNQRRRPGS